MRKLGQCPATRLDSSFSGGAAFEPKRRPQVLGPRTAMAFLTHSCPVRLHAASQLNHIRRSRFRQVAACFRPFAIFAPWTIVASLALPANGLVSSSNPHQPPWQLSANRHATPWGEAGRRPRRGGQHCQHRVVNPLKSRYGHAMSHFPCTTPSLSRTEGSGRCSPLGFFSPPPSAFRLLAPEVKGFATQSLVDPRATRPSQSPWRTMATTSSG